MFAVVRFKLLAVRRAYRVNKSNGSGSGCYTQTGRRATLGIGDYGERSLTRLARTRW